jgi:hypothetical protein
MTDDEQDDRAQRLALCGIAIMLAAIFVASWVDHFLPCVGW